MAIKIDHYAIAFTLYESGEPPRRPLTDKRGRRQIRCTILDTEHGVPVASATATCSDQDNFELETGRLVALRKATSNRLLVPKSLRAQLFQAYMTRGKK